MRTRLLPFAAILFAMLAVPMAPAVAEDTGTASAAGASESGSSLPAYGIQPGDVLSVSVWQEEGLQADVMVRPDGGISFPLVGDIPAAGKTVPQLSKLMTERISKYVSDPVVTVAVKQLLGNKIYVIGKVNRAGEFPITRYVDVMQALSMAGGTNPFAAVNDIKVLRRENGRQTAIPFRYADVEKGRALDQNIILQSGDVVVVP